MKVANNGVPYLLVEYVINTENADDDVKFVLDYWYNKKALGLKYKKTESGNWNGEALQNSQDVDVKLLDDTRSVFL